MRIPATPKLAVEDYPDQKSWIGKLFTVVNKFFSDVIAAVNGGIEFGTNIRGQEFLFDFNYQTTGVLPMGFSWSLLARPLGLAVISAYENGSPVIVSVAWQVFSKDTSVTVQLTDAVKLSSALGVSALTVGARYQIRVRVTP